MTDHSHDPDPDADLPDIPPTELKDDPTVPKRPPNSTAVLPIAVKLGAQGRAKVRRDSSRIDDTREIILVIRGIVQQVKLTEDGIVLGRGDRRGGRQPDIDLTPYGAADRGVSREHCRLYVHEGRMFVEDLGSTNGTFIAGMQLPPREAVALRKGDEVMLSRLAVQVLFK